MRLVGGAAPPRGDLAVTLLLALRGKFTFRNFHLTNASPTVEDKMVEEQEGKVQEETRKRFSEGAINCIGQYERGMNQ
jgi:hypothetical protein